MFTKARIKLTAYYLAIIMSVSMLLSVLAYRGFVYEMWRGLRLQGGSLPQSVINEIREEVANYPAPFGIFYNPARLGIIIDRQIYEEAKRRVFVTLIYINVAVFVTAGVGGYFLAGATLAPIEEVMNEQKRFVSDASHELRTPITSLKTEIEVALRDKRMTLKDAKRILRSNLDDVNKMQELASRLLELSRYNANVGLRRELVALDTIVKKVASNYYTTAKRKGIKLDVNLSEVMVKGDPERLSELVSIIIDNAIKYTPKGFVSVKLKKVGKLSELSVEDTGIGISEADAPHIFDRFYRADVSRNKEIDGFGLGLSIAKEIAEKHSATISFSSKLGAGSRFVVRIPVAK